MHHLTFRARGDQAELCYASTDERNARTIWCSLCKSAEKAKPIRRFGKRISVVDDQDQFTMWCGEIRQKRRRTHRPQLLLANRACEAGQANAIILICGEM
jgi:hypothetical protein